MKKSQLIISTEGSDTVLKYSKYAFTIIVTILLGLLPINVSSQGEVTCTYDTFFYDCTLWVFVADMYIDGSFSQRYVMAAGWWVDPYTLEIVIVHGGAPAPCQPIPPVTIQEPEHCLMKRTDACPKTPRYFMYTLTDENQPPEWQRYCYIISNNGIPSVESQARICSVPGYDHVYKATNIPYGGWVSTDCNGNPSYGWPHWQSSWYRPQFSK